MNKELKNTIEDILEEKIEYKGNNIIKSDSGKEYFLKGGEKSNKYRCEANGLDELAISKTIKVAKIISTGDNYILTEYIRHGAASGNFFIKFGKQLAKLHQYQNESFGFYEDNYIGENPQINIPDDDEKTDWTNFYFNKRLLFQYRMAERNGYATAKLKKGFINLESKIGSILKDSLETPCLLHGDLWAGNFICDLNYDPVLIDPAVYYGHREADLAMTKLFGGFPQSFYDSYNQEYPLKEGWQYRESLYKLYHILNHLNIFGRGYLSEAENLLSEY